MKLETLSGLIVQLVLENGRVMLPQLGAFMRETVPASFSDRGFTLLPPYRRLVFRESQGDGTLLCEALSRQSKLSPQRAQAEIEACVQALREQLEQENQALIPGLGRLKRTASGGLLFVQDEDLDVSGEWMALDAVSLKSQDRLAENAFRTAAAQKIPDRVGDDGQSESEQEIPDRVGDDGQSEPAQEIPDRVGDDGQTESEQEIPGQVWNDGQSESEQEIPGQAGNDGVVGDDGVVGNDEPAPAAETEPSSEPVAPAPPVMRDIPAEGEEEEEKSRPVWLVLLIVLLVLAVLFVVLFYVGVWFFPDILDKFLYDESQLELLKYFGLNR